MALYSSHCSIEGYFLKKSIHTLSIITVIYMKPKLFACHPRIYRHQQLSRCLVCKLNKLFTSGLVFFPFLVYMPRKVWNVKCWIVCSCFWSNRCFFNLQFTRSGHTQQPSNAIMITSTISVVFVSTVVISFSNSDTYRLHTA